MKLHLASWLLRNKRNKLIMILIQNYKHQTFFIQKKFKIKICNLNNEEANISLLIH